MGDKRGGLGDTTLQKNNIDALLGRSHTVPLPEPVAKERLTVKAAKLTDDEVKKVDLIKAMLSTTNTSDALRWCIRAVWIDHGEEIQDIAQKKESVGAIKLEGM